MVRKTGKEGIKKLCLWIGLRIIVYVLGSRLLLVPKNNENAIFIINIWPPKFYTKSGIIFFLLKYSSMSMSFWRKVAKITMVNSLTNYSALGSLCKKGG